MSISEIELICGQTPVGFKKEMITGSNHIFEVDPTTPLPIVDASDAI